MSWQMFKVCLACLRLGKLLSLFEAGKGLLKAEKATDDDGQRGWMRMDKEIG